VCLVSVAFSKMPFAPRIARSQASLSYLCHSIYLYDITDYYRYDYTYYCVSAETACRLALLRIPRHFSLSLIAHSGTCQIRRSVIKCELCCHYSLRVLQKTFKLCYHYGLGMLRDANVSSIPHFFLSVRSEYSSISAFITNIYSLVTGFIRSRHGARLSREKAPQHQHVSRSSDISWNGNRIGLAKVASSRGQTTYRVPIVQVVSRWTKIVKERPTARRKPCRGLKAQPRPHSSNAPPAEPAYPLVAGVAVPPLHRSDKEPRSRS